jgi:hypothetical protein
LAASGASNFRAHPAALGAGKEIAAIKKNPRQITHLGVWKVCCLKIRLLRWAAVSGDGGAAQRVLKGRHLATRRAYSTPCGVRHSNAAVASREVFQPR